jgi:XTP/dITP diphosphohydrolase
MGFRIYVATTSQGKLRDFRTAAQTFEVEIEPLPGLEKIEPPEEDAPTFEGNATHKAMYYSHFLPGELVIADDSGLEVDALSGAPGVRSARFASDAGLVDSPDAEDNTDVWNNIHLLQCMESVAPDLRAAGYHCALACAVNGQLRDIAHGEVRGVILDAPRGLGGFGYDPLFYIPELEKTMAEIDLETKLSLSHRGRALAGLLGKLRAASPEVR